MKKCVLVGRGYWGNIVKKYIENCDSLDLIAVVGKMDHEEYSCFIQNTEADIVLICTPKNTHFDLCRIALENHKDVFCEKPLTGNYEKAKQLFDIAARNDCILYTDYIYVFSDSINMIKNAILKSDKIQNIEMRLSQFGRFYPDSDALETIGVHLLSVLVYYFSLCNIEVKYANNSFIYNNPNATEQEVFLMINGDIPVYIKLSLNSPIKDRVIRVMTDKAVISSDLTSVFREDIVCFDNGEYRIETNSTEVCENDNLRTVVEDFVNVIDNRSNLNNMELCLNVEKLLEDIRKVYGNRKL